jgi:RNA polymerase sigma factor (sigma-70 family)
MKRSILGANRRRMMAAVVLGTALTTLGSASPASASPQAVGDISRYCTACWRNARLPADCWGDCTQEVFSRLLERVKVTNWDNALRAEGGERRELMRAIDAVKKRSQRGRKFNGFGEELADPSANPERELRDDREAVQNAARVVLSPRQRHIVDLTGAGWSVAEIANELSTSPERVSDEKYKAIRKLRVHLGIDG